MQLVGSLRGSLASECSGYAVLRGLLGVFLVLPMFCVRKSMGEIVAKEARTPLMACVITGAQRFLRCNIIVAWVLKKHSYAFDSNTFDAMQVKFSFYTLTCSFRALDNAFMNIGQGLKKKK